jgi:hypothetical protein
MPAPAPPGYEVYLTRSGETRYVNHMRRILVGAFPPLDGEADRERTRLIYVYSVLNILKQDLKPKLRIGAMWQLTQLMLHCHQRLPKKLRQF